MKLLIRRRQLCLIVFFMFFGYSVAMGQNNHVTVNLKNATLKELFSAIESQTTYRFSYRNVLIDDSKDVTVTQTNASVSDVLTPVLTQKGLTFSIISEKSIVVSENKNAAKQVKVAGTIYDDANAPVSGATIIEKGTNNGTYTGSDGKFELTVSSNGILEISSVGFATQELSVGSRTVFNVTLKEDFEQLDNVVVTALGIKREEKALGYAVQKVKGDDLANVKGVDVGTALTGKIAGMNVFNNTEFNSAPTIRIRGAAPLLVVDGIPYDNITLNEIAPEDIASIDVLKGATASALYGIRGQNGAIMVSTKRGDQEGLSVKVNVDVMFNAGHLKKPKVQSAYSSGSGGKYKVGDYVWGDKLDIGRTASQYNPHTYEWENTPLTSRGKDNLKNFQELSMITNANVSVSQKGKYGSVRSSLSHVYNKGQYPNTKLNKITYSVSGDIKWQGFEFEGGLTYNKRIVPNDFGAGYGGGGILYNLLVWSGPEFDIRDYKNYWVIKDEKQNWMDTKWYDNPYLIVNEITRESDYDIVNGFLTGAYNITDWLKLSIRSGMESYKEKKVWKNPIGAVGGWNKKGYYAPQRQIGYTINNDAFLLVDKAFGDFTVDGLLGGSIYYYQDEQLLVETQNGLSIPGYYSLKASNDPVKASENRYKRQINSLFGRATISWKNAIFVDITGRNDWNSTLDKQEQSYFYPSVAGSAVMSQLIPMPKFIDFWKLRGSWAVSKSVPAIYEINNPYGISSGTWDDQKYAWYPTSIKNAIISPATTRTYEFGTTFHFLKNRLRFDITYYDKLYYDNKVSAKISSSTGFNSTLINTEEEQVRRGVEIIISGDIIKTDTWGWTSSLNWAHERMYYAKIDPNYSSDYPWVAKGERWDWMTGVKDWERDPQGNLIHYAGYPKYSNFYKPDIYTSPDWTWGWSNTVSYKNFTLNFSLDGRVGGYAHSYTDQAMWNSGAHIDSDNKWRYDEVVNGLTNYVGNGVKIVSGSADYDPATGEITRDDRVFAPNDTEVSYETYMSNMNPYIGTVTTQNVFSQTFFKLRNLSLSYKLPQDAAKYIGAKGLTVGVVGQNLLIWAKEFKHSDPDRGSDNLNSPSIRYIGFNLKFDF